MYLLNNAGKWRDLERTAIEVENTHQLLRIDSERLKSELKAGQSKKRSSGEAGFEGTAGDTTESHMEDGVKKRGRREI
jgi:hypothetical protein